MTQSVRRYYTFFWVNYFVQSLVGIVYEPVNYILKDHLRLTPGGASGFYGWITLPLLFKPVYGYISDFLPIGPYRRKPHYALASLLAAVAFFLLAAQSSYRYYGLLFCLFLSIFGMAFADAVCGGLLIEDGKARQETGRYQALHVGALYLGVIVVGVGGGWMTSHVPFARIFTLAGFLPLAMIAAVSLISDRPRATADRPNAGALWQFMRTKRFWGLGATIILWHFYPFLGTVQFYYQTNVLHLSPQWIGSLMTLGSVAGFVGSAVFWKFCRHGNADRWVRWGPVAMALVSLTYLGYRGPISVTIVEIVFGFFTVFFRLALLDLIARVCPQDVEATSYALFLALIDLAMFGSNTVGGKLYDWVQPLTAVQSASPINPYVILILIGSVCTLACRWTLRFCRTAST